MADIKGSLDELTVSKTIALLNKQLSTIEDTIVRLNAQRTQLITRSQLLTSNAALLNQNNVCFKDIEDRKILIVKGTIHKYQDIDYSLKKLQLKHPETNYISSTSRFGAVASLQSLEQQKYGIYDSVFCILEKNAPRYDQIIPGGKYISKLHRGSYEEIGPLMNSLIFNYRNEGFQITGSPIEIYIIDEYDTSDSSEYLTEIQIPIRT